LNIELNFTDNDIGFLTSFLAIDDPHWCNIYSSLEPVKDRSDERFVTVDTRSNKRFLSQIFGGFVEATVVQKYLETQHGAETHLYYSDAEQLTWYIACDVIPELLDVGKSICITD